MFVNLKTKVASVSQGFKEVLLEPLTCTLRP